MLYRALALALPGLSSATILYASSYVAAGNSKALTTLDFTNNSLRVVGTSSECGVNPSWLELKGRTLYCVDEAWSGPHGTLNTFSASSQGALTKLDSIATYGGPVSTILYGEGSRGIAVAGYAGGGFETFNIADPANIVAGQSELFPARPPREGWVQDRQEFPRPHQVILDPTGEFIAVPDLGSDYIRIFRVDKATLAYTALEPLVVDSGSGPRHATFVRVCDKTFLYVISELSNTITGYEVKYTNTNSLNFSRIFTVGTHGASEPVPAGASAGEITASPDGKFLIISSRNESQLDIPSFEDEGETIKSDPLISFKINQKTGKLSNPRKFAAGGLIPRHFSLNKAGDRVAVALQRNSHIVIIDRDTRTGELKDFIAQAKVEGEPNNVIFDE